MESQGFFRLVWRFNALILAVAGVIVLVVGLYALYQIARMETSLFHKQDVARIAETEEVTATPPSVGKFSWLMNGRYFWAPIEVRQEYAYSSVRSKEARSVRNYVIFDVEQRTSHTMLPDNTGIVLRSWPLRLSGLDDPADQVFGIVVSMVDTDSNGDGVLSARDVGKVAITRPDGSGLTLLSPTAEQLRGVELIDPTTALLMIEDDGEGQALYISLEDFSVVQQVGLADGGR